MTFEVTANNRNADAMGSRYMRRMQVLKEVDGLTDAFTGFVTDPVHVEEFKTGVFILQFDFGDATSIEAQLQISQNGSTWAPWPDEGTAAAGVYTQKSRVDKYLAADQAVDTNSEQLLGSKNNANMNVTTDQAITLTERATLLAEDPIWNIYQVSRIVASDPSTSLTAADGGIYPTTSKGGTPIVAATQVYTALVNPSDTLELTLDSQEVALSVGTLYLSLTGTQGGAATADFAVYGIPAPVHELAFEFGNVIWARMCLKHTGGTDDIPQGQVFFRGGR